MSGDNTQFQKFMTNLSPGKSGNRMDVPHYDGPHYNSNGPRYNTWGQGAGSEGYYMHEGQRYFTSGKGPVSQPVMHQQPPMPNYANVGGPPGAGNYGYIDRPVVQQSMAQPMMGALRPSFPLAHTLTFSLARARALSLSHTHRLSLSHTHTQTLSPSLAHPAACSAPGTRASSLLSLQVLEGP